MTLSFELVNSSDAMEKIDFTTGALRLLAGGYAMLTPASRAEFAPSVYGAQMNWQGFDLVTDTFQLVGAGTDAEIRAALDQLAVLLDLGRAYHRDPTNQYPTLLRWNAPNETQRQALVYDGQFQVGGEMLDASLARGATEVTLTLTRGPLWEQLPGNTISGSAGEFESWGGKFAVDAASEIGETLVGSAPTRLFLFGPYNSDQYIESVWVGLKRASSFYAPTLEAEKGTLGADASVVGGAAYSGGSAVQCSFAGTAGLATRFTLSLYQADPGASTFEWYIGRYLVLARVHIDTGTVGLQLYTGDKGAQVTPAAEEVLFAEANTWRLVPLGEIQIPARGYHVMSSYPAQTWDVALRSFTFALRAEKISGSPTLTVDALALVPAENMWTATVDDNATAIQFSQEMDGRITTYASSGSSTDSLQMYGVAQFTARDFGVPRLSKNGAYHGRVNAITFYERPTGHTLTDNARVAQNLVHRWLTYRND